MAAPKPGRRYDQPTPAFGQRWRWNNLTEPTEWLLLAPCKGGAWHAMLVRGSLGHTIIYNGYGVMSGLDDDGVLEEWECIDD